MYTKKSYMVGTFVLIIFIGAFPRLYGPISSAKQSLSPDKIVSSKQVTPTQVKTHFFAFLQKDYSHNLWYQWIADSKSQFVFTFSSDKDFDGDQTMGGKNSRYELSKIDISDISNPQVIQSIPIDLKYAGDSKYRILDFKSSVQDSSSTRTKIFLSYASNDLESNCRYLNLVSFVVSLIGDLRFTEFKRWFRSPCMSGLDVADFRLHQSGGAILEIKNAPNTGKALDEVYLTVGDFMNLGFSGEQILESTKSILGSLLRIRSDGTTFVVAKGFRNPQGVGFFETSNKTQILQSEHGPRGGDELNEIIEGNFYGWPEFSYGTPYGPKDYGNSIQNPNTSGTSSKPIFSWIPSIGPSQVYQVKSSTLKEFWSDSNNGYFGDVLVAGMASKSLYRLRILDSRVVYSEAIFLGFRIRSLIERPDGVLIFGTDSGMQALIPSQKWSIPLGIYLDLNYYNNSIFTTYVI